MQIAVIVTDMYTISLVSAMEIPSKIERYVYIHEKCCGTLAFWDNIYSSDYTGVVVTNFYRS
jgi:hypothetical protein